MPLKGVVMGLFTMYLFKAAAVFSAIIGILLLFFPKLLIKINETGTRMLLQTEQYLTKHRIIFGILMLICSLLLFYLIKTIPLKL